MGVSDSQSVTGSGIEYRPNLLAATSFDGSIATTWRRTIKMVICDNTFEIARAISGQVFKIKHTKNAGFEVGKGREALNILEQTSEAFDAEVRQLIETTVTDAQWRALLDAQVPLEEKGHKLTGRALGTASRKRDELHQLYTQTTA